MSTTTQSYKQTKDMSREEWLQQRRQGIGGSDAAAILGLHPYKTAVDVWLEKIGELHDEPSSDLIWFGTKVEPLIGERFSHETGRKVQRDHKMRVHDEYEYIMGNMDRLVLADNENPTGVLEIKSTSRWAQQSWDTDIAAHWYIQLQHYLLVTGYSHGYIAYLVDRNYDHKRFGADTELHEQMISAYKEFWACVEDSVPPATQTEEDVEKLFKQHVPEKEVEAGPKEYELHNRLCELKAEKDEIKEQISDVKARLKEAMEDAEALVNSDGDRLVTWKKVEQSRVDSKRLREEKPDIYEDYQKQYSYRQFMPNYNK